MDNIFEFKIDIDKFDYESYTELKNKYFFEELLELKEDFRLPLILNESVITKIYSIPICNTLGFISEWYYDKIVVKILSNHLSYMQSLNSNKAYHCCIGAIKNNLMYPYIILAFSLGILK